MQTITYAVSGLTCGGCVNRVTQALTPFAEDVHVTLDPPCAILNNANSDLNKLNQVLSDVGHYVLSPTEIAQTEEESNQETASILVTYKPLMLVFAYIVLVCGLIEYAHGGFVLHRFMPNFMAGFFLVFSFFKLLDIAGFASSYRMYDLLAKRLPAYGYLYPLIELGLGIAYLINGQSALLNWVTFIIMAFSTLGVVLAVLDKQKIRCACLGAVFNLPMSTVTIIEDVLMAAMALWMAL